MSPILHERQSSAPAQADPSKTVLDRLPASDACANDLLAKARSEDRILLACARWTFQDQHRERVMAICRTSALDWRYVVRTAIRHGVAPLVYRNLRQLPSLDLPAAVDKEFRAASGADRLAKALAAERLSRILSSFRLRSLDLLLVKGAAHDAVLYQGGSLLTSDDLDLVIRRPDYPVTEDELAEFREGTSAVERLTPVEIEWSAHHDLSMNGMLAVDFDEVWRNARQITVAGQTAWVMRPEHMLIAACVNSCRKRFFRLKSLCDIHQIVTALPIDWRLAAETANRWNCAAIVFCSLTASALAMESPIPPQVLRELHVAPLQRKLIRYLVRNMAFESLDALSGRGDDRRRWGTSLGLPIAAFTWRQRWKNLGIVRDLWRHNRRQRAQAGKQRSPHLPADAC